MVYIFDFLAQNRLDSCNQLCLALLETPPCTTSIWFGHIIFDMIIVGFKLLFTLSTTKTSYNLTSYRYSPFCEFHKWKICSPSSVWNHIKIHTVIKLTSLASSLDQNTWKRKGMKKERSRTNQPNKVAEFSQWRQKHYKVTYLEW